MVEVEVYAAGIRNPAKMMGLAVELDTVPSLRYKVDTNHDIVYMEFLQQPLTLNDLTSIFNKLGLRARFVGAVPQGMRPKSKTTLLRD